MKHFDRRHFVKTLAAAGLFVPAAPAILTARTLMTAPITLYWGFGGSASGDGSAGNPFDCQLRAWQYAQRSFDLGGMTGLVILFQQTPGTCVIPTGMTGNLSGPLPGQIDATSVKFLGDAVNPNNCTVDARSAGTVAYGAIFGAQYSFGGARLKSGQANVAIDGAGSRAINSDKVLSDTCQDYSFSATNYGRLDLVADNDIYSLSASYLNVFGGDITVPQGGRVVRVMVPGLACSQGFVSASDGRIVDSNTSYPQDGITTFNVSGPRAVLGGDAYVHTGSAAPLMHFPGTSAVVFTGGAGSAANGSNGNNLL